MPTFKEIFDREKDANRIGDAFVNLDNLLSEYSNKYETDSLNDIRNTLNNLLCELNDFELHDLDVEAMDASERLEEATEAYRKNLMLEKYEPKVEVTV